MLSKKGIRPAEMVSSKRTLLITYRRGLRQKRVFCKTTAFLDDLWGRMTSIVLAQLFHTCLSVSLVLSPQSKAWVWDHFSGTPFIQVWLDPVLFSKALSL
jgi:hypothetical protein